jgi:hypothetical protein
MNRIRFNICIELVDIALYPRALGLLPPSEWFIDGAVKTNEADWGGKVTVDDIFIYVRLDVHIYNMII